MLEGTTVVWAREIVTFVHFLGAIVAFGAVVSTDAANAFMKLNPRVAEANARTAHVFSLLIWLGLLLLSTTGILLVLDHPPIVHDWLFQAKMLLVVVVFVNGLVLNEYITPRFEQLAPEWEEQTPRVQRFVKVAGISAAVSLLAWLGAVLAGYLL